MRMKTITRRHLCYSYRLIGQPLRLLYYKPTNFRIMNEKEMIILCDGSTRYAEVDVTELKDGRWRGTWNGHNLTFHGGTWME
jgi:hypothetical protein